ncbi:type II secretion system F family protein [Halomonas huangheensis]|nr:type II secretion system F family protein [Halomonas huangheensis]ALM52831.1 type II secretion system protein F [Halomonas huangheensis]
MKHQSPRGMELYHWHWTGRSKDGRRLSGEIVAHQRSEIQQQLRDQGIAVKGLRQGRRWRSRRGRIQPRDIMHFSRQLAELLQASIPLPQALGVLATSLNNPAMRSLVLNLRQQVSDGASLSRALHHFPRHFDALYCSMVEAGEQSGRLDQLLKRLAEHLERRESLAGRVRKALWYPACVVLVGLLITAILLTRVVPQFEQMFASFGAELPPLTRMTLSLSALAREWWLTASLLAVSCGFLLRAGLYRSPTLRLATERMMRRLPAIGMVLERAAVARFCRTLSATHAADVPLVDGLTTASGATDSHIYRQAINAIREDIASGQQLYFAMHNSRQFPTLAIQLVRIGEESGTLNTMLTRLAEYYEEDVERRADTLTTLLEPLIIVVLGVLVGGLILSMYLPILELGNVM